MGIFSEIFNAVASGIKTVVHVAADVTSTFANVVTTKYREIKRKYASYNISELKKTRFDELVNINDEIIEFERKLKIDGQLNSSENNRLSSLLERRNILRNKIEAAKEVEAAEEISDGKGEFQTLDENTNSPNHLIKLGGQVMLNKLCPACQRPQTIRWRSTVLNPTINDLFWGCSGYFVKDHSGQRACTATQRLSEEDKKIFTDISRPGLELSTERLHDIILRPRESQIIKNKMSDAIGQNSENYLCPIHHEKMQLKQKSNPLNILDLYYLKCPRCDQTVKIHSAPQLDAILQIFDQGGLFSP